MKVCIGILLRKTKSERGVVEMRNDRAEHGPARLLQLETRNSKLKTSLPFALVPIIARCPKR